MRRWQFIACVASVFLQSGAWGVLSDDPNFLARISEEVAKRKEGGILNVSFKSVIDGQVQPVLFKIPKGYDPGKKWPLLVVLHGRGDGPIVVPSIDSMVQIGPYGRGDCFYRGLGESDVFETLAMAKRIFSIDEDRIYLTGFSMGAMGTFELGLKYPYLWAACVPVCGKLDNPLLIENGGNLPFWIHAGDQDHVIPARYSRVVYELGKVNSGWRFTAHQEMGHSFRINWQEAESWLLGQIRQSKVTKIKYSGRTLGRIYWLEIQKLTDPEVPYSIDAQTEGQTIYLTTSNIELFQVHVNECPLSIDEPVVVFHNGTLVDLESEGVVVR